MAISLRKFKTSHAVKSRRPLITAQEDLHMVFMTGKWINDQFTLHGNRALKGRAESVVSDQSCSSQAEGIHLCSFKKTSVRVHVCVCVCKSESAYILHRVMTEPFIRKIRSDICKYEKSPCWSSWWSDMIEVHPYVHGPPGLSSLVKQMHIVQKTGKHLQQSQEDPIRLAEKLSICYVTKLCNL